MINRRGAEETFKVFCRKAREERKEKLYYGFLICAFLRALRQKIIFFSASPRLCGENNF
jgi:hypothetical protein